MSFSEKDLIDVLQINFKLKFSFYNSPSPYLFWPFSLLIRLDNLDHHNNNKYFHLENYWYAHQYFKAIVSGCWLNRDLIPAYHHFFLLLRIEVESPLGTLIKGKIMSLLDWRVFKITLFFGNNFFIQNLSIHLISNYNDILKIEEDHYRTRSCINYINDGDTNTKFYHISVLK